MVESSQSEQAEHEALVHVRECIAALSRSEKGRKAALARVDELDRELQLYRPPPSDGTLIETFRFPSDGGAAQIRYETFQRIRNERTREEWESMVNDRDHELHRAEQEIVGLKQLFDAAQKRIADFEAGIAIGARRNDAT